MPPEKASKSEPKAEAPQRARAPERDWLTTAELAAKIGWRTHALRDALRGRRIEGVVSTSFGYRIEASAVEQIAKAMGPPPPKPNSPRQKAPAGARRGSAQRPASA